MLRLQQRLKRSQRNEDSNNVVSVVNYWYEQVFLKVWSILGPREKLYSKRDQAWNEMERNQKKWEIGRSFCFLL